MVLFKRNYIYYQNDVSQNDKSIIVFIDIVKNSSEYSNFKFIAKRWIFSAVPVNNLKPALPWQIKYLMIYCWWCMGKYHTIVFKEIGSFCFKHWPPLPTVLVNPEYLPEKGCPKGGVFWTLNWIKSPGPPLEKGDLFSPPSPLLRGVARSDGVC